MLTRILAVEPLHLFAPSDDWPLLSEPETPANLDDIAGLELVLPSSQHDLRSLVERAARGRGLELNVVLEMDALAQIKELVARGSGYTILSEAAAADLLAAGRLLHAPIADPSLRRTVYMVRNADSPGTPASRAVERITDEVVQDLVKRGLWQAELAVPA